MKIIRSLFCALVLIALQSCVTMFSGTQQDISFTSEPSGAEIFVNSVPTDKKTPATLKLDRKVEASAINDKNQYKYTFKYPGYNDETITDNASLNELIILDYFFIYGLPIDFASGAVRRYDSDVHAVLKKKQESKVDTIVKKEIVYVPAESGKKEYVFQKNSDVDTNIPVVSKKHEYRYALIIGNEDYSSHQVDLSEEANVEFARNDASAFKEYALNVLGIPAENIIFLLDATTGQMNQAISKANLIIKNTRGKADFFVYYAGHGLPDEQTREAYIMPVDVSGKNANEGFALKNMYQKLTEYPSQKITVFIDACFSGGARNQGLLASRGVKVNPKENPLSGNLVVFSASSGEQSSLPFNEKEHGFFTYYLLKKLQETSGVISYFDLSDYLNEKVSLKSVLINNKEQNPKVNVSPESQDVWQSWKINE